MFALLLAACNGTAERPAAPPPKGIVLVSMDTVRVDFTSVGGAPEQATPTLSALIKQGVTFDHAYAASNETLFSHGSMFTSRAPSHVAPVDYDWTIPEGTPTLASQLGAAGYATAAVVAGGHLARVFGLTDGFDAYTEAGQWGSFQQSVPMALKWVDQAVAAGKPFFLFVHGYDAHSPYVKPAFFARMATPNQPTMLGPRLFDPLFYEHIYRDRIYPDFQMVAPPNASGTRVLEIDSYERLIAHAQTPGVRSVELSAQEQAFIRGAYGSAVLYGDLWVGVLLEELRARELLDTTTVVVMSDHGDGLLDHDFYNHRTTTRDTSTRVPLVVRPPGGVAPVRVSTPVSLLDLTPTLLEIAGATASPALEGESLLPCFHGDCADRRLPYSEGAMREVSITDGTHRLLVRGARAEDPDLDEKIRTGAGVRIELYESGEGERIDHAGEEAMAPVIDALRTALLAARAGPR